MGEHKRNSLYAAEHGLLFSASPEKTFFAKGFVAIFFVGWTYIGSPRLYFVVMGFWRYALQQSAWHRCGQM